MPDTGHRLARREFLRGVGVGTAGIGMASGVLAVRAEPVTRAKRYGANDKIVLGLIGCGNMGPANMYNLMEKPEVEVAALCDVDQSHLGFHAAAVEKKYGKRPTVYKDFRKLLERKDIDGVIIGTPDHWHALPLILACEAGKDVYCEKPISHDITEARYMDAAVGHFKRIVQVGTWQRSTSEFVSALAYVRAGKLGKVTTVRAWMKDTAQVGRNTVSAVPAGFDYDFWMGPAAATPYRQNETHANWRWFLNFGSGMTGDWGVHMMDIGLLGMSASTNLPMPVEISTVGGKLAYPDDDRTAPDTVSSVMRFKDPDFIMQWDTARDHPGRPDHGTEFVAADGKSLMVWRGGWMIRDASGEELPKENTPATNDHWQNWLDCIKSREQPRSNLASMAQTTIVCHLVNAAYLTGETVHWDKAKMDIVGKPGRETRSYYREYRRPWKLPVYTG